MNEELINKLFVYFVGNENVYAEQTSGGYKTIYKPITRETLKRMISERQSFLSYQFIGESVKWICFDFDIKKEIYESSNYESKRNKYHNNLLEIIKSFCARLKTLGIKYLVEFSGNRGFHVWIAFNKPFKGHAARSILGKIKEESNLELDESIYALDEFPKNSYRNGKIGYGVKLPLSLHKKSGYYSYLFDISNINKGFNFYIKELSESIIIEQVRILNAFSYNSFETILSKLKIEIKQETEIKIAKFIKARKPTLSEKNDLDTVLKDLEKCNILQPIIKKYKEIANDKIESSLNEKERVFIVGLINRLKVSDEKYYGKKLLKEFFSRLPNYKENLTEKKLGKLNLYPITCEYLKIEYPDLECPCKFKENEEVFKTPIELITSIDTETLSEDVFDIWEEDINRIVQSQINYIRYNDEVDLAFQIEELEQFNARPFINKFLYYLDCQKKIDEYYVFKRIEDDEKERSLVSLSITDKILTTAFIKILDSIYYTEWSSNSYGYKFINSFVNNQIFEPWLKQWNIYIKGLEDIIFNPDFKDYYVIKLDIKSFYSEIDLDRLELKLLQGATEGAKQKIKDLDEHSQEKYFNICKTFISYCRTISKKGVPQGPAYARYLAEIYLIQVDRFIEERLKGSERYFRYVDDMFIILNRDSHTLSNLHDNIVSFIQTHNLSINQQDEKYFLGSVLDYQNEFFGYKDKTKYFIDYSHKNQKVISSTGTKMAIKDMFLLLESKRKHKIKNENLNFFFTHFNSSLLVNEKKKELEKHILSTTIGRGSLFRNFYNFYFELIERGCAKIHNEVYNLSGLNRTAFFNAFLKYISTHLLSDIQQVEFKKIIDYYVNIELENHEKEILFHIMFKDKSFINSQYFTQSNFEIIKKVINTETKKNIPDEIISFLLSNIEHIALYEKVRLIYKTIFFNDAEKGIIAKLKDVFLNSVLEELKTHEPEKFTLSIFENTNDVDKLEIIYQFYQLLCLFSITKSSTQKNPFATISPIWINLISYANRNKPALSDNSLSWVKFIDRIDLDISIIDVVITCKIEDNFVDIKPKGHDLCKDFYNGVVYAFYFKNKIVENKDLTNVLSQDAEVVIKKLIENQNFVFLEWLQNDSTTLYPDKDICLLNIIHNERLVLKQDNKILVRIKTKISNIESKPLKDYLHISVKEITEKDNQFKSVIYEFVPTDYQPIINQIREKDNLIEVFEYLINVKNTICEFKKEYHNNLDDFFPNISNGDISKELIPLIPYSIFDNKPVINAQKFEDINNDGKFLGNLLSLIKLEDLKELNLLEYQHPNSLGGSEILSSKDVFFPKSFKHSIFSKFEYLEKFVETYQAVQPEYTTAFHLEYAKMHTLYHLLIQKQSHLGENEIIPKVIYNLLFDYHSMYKSGEYHKKLIFDIHTEIDSRTLWKMYKSVFSSIENFISILKPSKSLNIKKLFLLELIKIEELCNKFWQEKQAVSLSAKKCKLDGNVDVQYNEVKTLERCNIEFKNETKLLLNKKVIFYVDEKEQDKIFVLKAFNDDEYKISKLQINDISNLPEEIYYKEKDSVYLLVVPDNSIESSFSTIEDRKIEVQESQYNNRTFHIECYEYPMPVDEIIQNNLPEFNEAIKVLTNHYYKSIIFKSENELRWHLINWLRLFVVKPEIVRDLLRIIAAHQSIPSQAIESFKEEISKLQEDINNILVSTKILEDNNGLHRLLNFTQNRQILSKLHFVNNIFNATVTNNTNLVLLTDIGISGRQMIDGLNYYFCREDFEINENKNEDAENDLAYDKKIKLENYERYYDINKNQINKFRGKLNQIRWISIVASAYTDKFRETAEKFIHEKINKNIVVTFFPDNHNWKMKNCLLNENSKIRQSSVNSFIGFYKDTETLKGIFYIKKDVKRKYDNQIKENEFNTVVRLHSVPKKSVLLFNMQPRNEGKPLFYKLNE